jgi:hypothetical protein
LQDIFDLIESHITKQEPSYQSFSNWQAGLDEVFEKLCKEGYGREEIRQSRDFLQSLKRSDEEQYTRSRLLAGTLNLHRVRTAVPDLPIDQMDREVDGIQLLSLGESLFCDLFGFLDTGCRWRKVRVNIAAANLARTHGTWRRL